MYFTINCIVRVYRERKIYAGPGGIYFVPEIKISKIQSLLMGKLGNEFSHPGRFEACVSFCTGSFLCFFTFLKKRGSLEYLWELYSIKERQMRGPVPGRQGFPALLPCCWHPGTGVPHRELDLSAKMGNSYNFTLLILTCVLLAFIAWMPNAFSVT